MCLFTLPSIPLAGEKVIRVACVGDSITEGTLLKQRAAEAYPAQLAKRLGAGYEVRNFGKSGATVNSAGAGALPYNQQPEYQQALEFRPDWVVVMLGTNDAKEPVWEAGKEHFAEAYRALLRSFTASGQKPRILLCRPVPVLGEGRFGIKEENRREILPILEKLAAEEGLPLVDFDPLMKDRQDLYLDPVHPNAKGTKTFAQAIGEALAKFE